MHDRDQDEVLKIERLVMANTTPYAHEIKYPNYRKCLQLKERDYVIEGNDFKFLDELIRCWLHATVSIATEELHHASAKNLGFEN